jgi:DNA-binding MarR family transcriptional regulator
VKLDALVEDLDVYFRVPDVRDDDWAETFEHVYPEPYWREYTVPGWEGRWNGLVVRGANKVRQVVTCVFPSDRIVAGLKPATLLFTEHPVDFADEPGFLPLSLETYEVMRENGISLYNVHAPLDMHPEVSPSRLCAQGVGLERLEEYFPICEGISGGAVVAGDSQLTVDGLADALRSFLGPEIKVHVLTRARGEAGRVAMACRRGRGGRDPRGGARTRLPDLRDRQRGDQLQAGLRPGAGSCLPGPRRRGRRLAHRRDALRDGEAAAARDGRVVPRSWDRRQLRPGRAEVVPKKDAGRRAELVLAAEMRATLRRLLRRTEELAAEQGLTSQRYTLLLQIEASPKGESTVGELTEKLQLGQTAVTEIVKRAVAAGLVERRRSEEDARVSLLRLTPEGSRRMYAVFDSLEADRDVFFAAFAELGKSVRAYRK